MLEPEWVKILGILAPCVATLMAFLLGGARKNGADQSKLAALSHDVDELKAARIEQGGTLAAHKALHAGYGETFGSFGRDMKKVSDDVAYIRGRMDNGRRGANTE